jgi:hypothetical protein
MSAPPDPSKPTEIIAEVFNSPEPPSPLIQTENALDDLEETLTELAKHGAMPARLQRKVDLLVAKVRDRIIHMRIDNPALKELMLIAGGYLGRKMQTDRATEAKRGQFEMLITAIRRFKPTIVDLRRRDCVKDLVGLLAKDEGSHDAHGEPLFGMSVRQIRAATGELLKRIQK